MLHLESYTKSKDHIVFDWNGTILNDVDLSLDLVNQLLKANGIPTINRDQHRQKFKIPIEDYYTDLGFDFSSKSFRELSDTWVKGYGERVGECGLFEGCRELLEGLRDAGKTLSILSAAHEAHIHELLKEYDLDHFFTHVYGLDNTDGASKVARAEQMLREKSIAPDKAIMIGDTRHDYDVACEVGMEIILLADGHQCYSVLKDLDCQVFETRYGAS